jgi:hypothetical protein
MSTQALRTAVIARLKAAGTTAGQKVFTPPVKSGTEPPYLVISGYSERPINHQGGSGAAADGFNIQGVVRLVAGDAPLLTLYTQVKAALQDQAITPAGHMTTYGDVRYVTDYAEPSDAGLRLFVCRYEATVVAAA